MKPVYKGFRLVSGDTEKAVKKQIETRRENATKNANGRPTFDYFATHDEEFIAACERAGIKPTARQASKWHRKKGLAYQHRNTGNEQAA